MSIKTRLRNRNHREFRVAVCLSGQARTWRTARKNILRFFSGDGRSVEHVHVPHYVSVDYFCHTWDTNTWWRDQKFDTNANEQISDQELAEIPLAFDAVGWRTDPLPNAQHWKSWYSMFQSMQHSMNLKRQHEITHGFEYDLVIRARYDVIFPPEHVFPYSIPQPLSAYTHVPLARFPWEQYRVDFHDVLLWGDSITMDIVGNLARRYETRCNPEDDPNWNVWGENCSFCAHSGPGVLLYEHMVASGVMPRSYQTPPWGFGYTPVRERAEKEGLDSVDHYDEIKEIAQQMYRKEVGEE